MAFNGKGAALATRPPDISSNHAGTFKAKSPKLQGRIEVKPSPALRALKRAIAQATDPTLRDKSRFLSAKKTTESPSLARTIAALEVARGRQ
jgi:hypothetical protein